MTLQKPPPSTKSLASKNPQVSTFNCFSPSPAATEISQPLRPRRSTTPYSSSRKRTSTLPSSKKKKASPSVKSSKQSIHTTHSNTRSTTSLSTRYTTASGTTLVSPCSPCASAISSATLEKPLPDIPRAYERRHATDVGLRWGRKGMGQGSMLSDESCVVAMTSELGTWAHQWPPAIPELEIDHPHVGTKDSVRGHDAGVAVPEGKEAKHPHRPARPTFFLKDIISLPPPLDYPWEPRSRLLKPPLAIRIRHDEIKRAAEKGLDATTTALAVVSTPDMLKAQSLVSKQNITHLVVWEYEAYLALVSTHTSPRLRHKVVADAGFFRLKLRAIILGLTPASLRVWEMVGLLRELKRRQARRNGAWGHWKRMTEWLVEKEKLVRRKERMAVKRRERERVEWLKEKMRVREERGVMSEREMREWQGVIDEIGERRLAMEQEQEAAERRRDRSKVEGVVDEVEVPRGVSHAQGDGHGDAAESDGVEEQTMRSEVMIEELEKEIERMVNKALETQERSPVHCDASEKIKREG